MIVVVREGRHLRTYSRRERRAMRRVWRSGNDLALAVLIEELRVDGDRAPFRSIAEAGRVSLLDVYLAAHRGDTGELTGNRW